MISNNNSTNQKELEPDTLSPTTSTEACKRENEEVVPEPAEFPVEELQRLDEMLNRSRWVVPVLPKNELENLLDASISLCRSGIDTQSEPCQRFFREGLTVSFIRIFTDDAVNTWKYDIYKHIYNNTLKAIELCKLKLLDDWFPLLDLLAIIFNPQCKYHIINSMRSSDMSISIEKNKTSTNKERLSPTRNDQVPEKLDEEDSKSKANEDLIKEEENNLSSELSSNEDSKEKNKVNINRNDDSENEKILNQDDDEDDELDQEVDDDEDDYPEEPDDINDADNDADDDDDDDENIERLKDDDDRDESNKIDKKTFIQDYIKNSIYTNTNLNDEVEFEKTETTVKSEQQIKNCLANNNMRAKQKKSVSIIEQHKNETLSELLSSSPNKVNEKLNYNPLEKCEQNKGENIDSSLSSQYEITYGRSYTKASYGWLVDFINHFGHLRGFDLLLERFVNSNHGKLNIPIIISLLKPWGLCYQFLTDYTVKTYFLPIISTVSQFFENLSDDDIKKECKSESKHDSISSVIKWLKLIASRCYNQETLCKNLEILRLKIILKILKFASFNGKMNALNEVNKFISKIALNAQLRPSSTVISNNAGSNCSSTSFNWSTNSRGLQANDYDEECLTSDSLINWIRENEVLGIVLRDCMHQPQYVEKLERILSFLCKEKALTLRDLDKIWESQLDKHEAIEKNVHDLLSKLAWDFTPEQLDHLFMCFQKSWTNASRKQREKLLDLIRLLSEDDKEGIMANKVLDLLWNLAHSEDAPTEIIDQAIASHTKILDLSCSVDKESQKMKYLEKCIEKLKDNKWVIISLRQIREILQQYPEALSSQYLNRFNGQNLNLSSSGLATQGNSSTNYFYRSEIIAKLQKEYSLISMITANLANYYETIRNYVEEQSKDASSKTSIDPETLLNDGRFNHLTQIQERLHFLKYLLKEGQLWLCASQAETIWKCLAQNSVFESDREICFKWFSKLMTEDSDLEPEMAKTFFQNYITKLDPKLLTDSGIKCFDRFFKYVNIKYFRIVQKKNYFLTENLDLIGIDYLWKIVSFANEEIVEKAIVLLKETYIHLGPQLKMEQSSIHVDLISNCMDRLRVSFDTLRILTKSDEKVNAKEQEDAQRITQEINQILRVIIVLKEYLNEFDMNYSCERLYPPLCRASKGKSLILIVRLQMQNRQTDDLELLSHVNETIGSLRRQIYLKTKLNPQMNKIELIINNECVECSEDYKVLGEFSLKEKMLIMARVMQTSSHNTSNPNNNSNLSIHTTNSTKLDSSGESSSDECASGVIDGVTNSSDNHHVIKSPNMEFELMLPSVILSLNEQYVNFLIDLADFACQIKNGHIRDSVRSILDLLPVAKHIGEKLKNFCKEQQQQQEKQASSNSKKLEALFTNCTPTQLWYLLKVTHVLLMPSVYYSNADEIKKFQEHFIQADGVTCFKNMLVKEDLVYSHISNANQKSIYDDNMRKAALLYILKIYKLAMASVCHAIYTHVLNAVSSKQFSQINESQHSHALLLQNAASSIPSCTNEIALRTLAQRLGSQFSSLLLNNLPTLTHVNILERVAWSLAANCTLDLVSMQTVTYEQIHDILVNNKYETSNVDDINVCREALECLSLTLCLLPNALENLNKEKHWRQFIIDLIIICNNRIIRQSASEQFLLIALKCSPQANRPIQFLIQMLFTCLHTLVNKHAQQSQEYFYLLCRSLNCANLNQVQISNIDALLNNEIQWLKKFKQVSLGADAVSSAQHKQHLNLFNDLQENLDENEMLLDGHLNITKELLSFQSCEKKHFIGSHAQGNRLINELIEYFLFPASYLFKRYKELQVKSQENEKNQISISTQSLKPICVSSMTMLSTYDLLVSLCTGSLANLNELTQLLCELFYPSLIPNETFLNNDCTIAQAEWEYMPAIGQRPYNGFVGLKNAGATCYMNSVLQQLFMIKEIRNFILNVDTSCLELSPASNQQANNQTNQQTLNINLLDDLDDTDLFDDSQSGGQEICSTGADLSENDKRKDYNMTIFRHLQMIFGHLCESKMQYYIPKGFWRSFRFGGFGERVNLREQHDAVEFFNSIVDCIDESMKSINREQICSKILGGKFADQKICKGCPHRYSREESFTLLSVDVKHSQSLSESLEQYVKGDLLEGPNAYHCEKCDKKIDAIKRTCIKKLPQMLAIQLKRFDYDWERDIAVKSNEYFEFPREIDMEPYTVKGIARLEQQQQQHSQKQTDQTKIDENILNYENDSEDELDKVYSNKYKLFGVVVHSGQANGGHYYSFIRNRVEQDTANENDEQNWFKFDDGDVSEFKMDDDEMRSQCYGGDYTGEVYDNVMKRMSLKKQKRWWNAYILFYERLKQTPSWSSSPNSTFLAEKNKETESNTEAKAVQQEVLKMPHFVMKSVQKKNIKFLHHRLHFSSEYFQFIKKLVQTNLNLCQSENNLNNDEIEDLCEASVKFAMKFLFFIGFRVKKTLRGNINDWYEILFSYAKYSQKARTWMIYYLLVENSISILQYFLDCPSNEIRNTISKIFVALVHLSYNDPPIEIKLSNLLKIPSIKVGSVAVLVTNSNQKSNATSSNNLNGTTITSLNNILSLINQKSLSNFNSNESHFIRQSDSIIHTLLGILNKRDLINEHTSKYLTHYFQFFNFYSSLGLQQCLHLINCDVPFVLMQFALEELPTTSSNLNLSSFMSNFSTSSLGSMSLNYSKLANYNSSNNNHNNSNSTVYSSTQYVDLAKLFSVVSTLLRCFDVSEHCLSHQTNQQANSSNSTLPNVYSYQYDLNQQQQQQQQSQKSLEHHSLKLPSKIEDFLYKRLNYVKKVLEDAPNTDETIKLMKFLCWENMNFSTLLLNELLWMAAYHYSYELKPHLDMLYHILNITDTWQLKRIECALQGIPDERDGLFEIIAKSQNHYQKRAYQIIKMLVQLFTQSEMASSQINSDNELKAKWKSVCDWFYNEMEKCRLYNMPNYSYYQSAQQSNETSQTYFLERTQSAQLTLEKAMRLCPSVNENMKKKLDVESESEDEDGEEGEDEDEGDGENGDNQQKRYINEENLTDADKNLKPK